jgi:hypothetical protein
MIQVTRLTRKKTREGLEAVLDETLEKRKEKEQRLHDAQVEQAKQQVARAEALEEARSDKKIIRAEDREDKKKTRSAPRAPQPESSTGHHNYRAAWGHSLSCRRNTIVIGSHRVILYHVGAIMRIKGHAIRAEKKGEDYDDGDSSPKKGSKRINSTDKTDSKDMEFGNPVWERKRERGQVRGRAALPRARQCKGSARVRL